MFTCEWKTLTYPKGASPKHATGQPSCKSSRTSSPHLRITSNHCCAMAPNSPACSFIHASMAGSRSTAPSNRSNSVLIISLLSAFESGGYVTEGLPVNRYCRIFCKNVLGPLRFNALRLPRASLDGPDFNDGRAHCPNHLHHRKARFL